MRKTLVVLVCAAALVVTAGDAWAAARARATAEKKVVSISRSATSPLVDVSRWGRLQLTIKVTLTKTTVGSKTTKSFKVTDVAFPVFPDHTDRSAFISSQALPLLRREILQLKGSSIALVSGATDTSYAFVEALRGALVKAGA